MKTKLVALAAVILVLTIVAIIRTAPGGRQQPSQREIAELEEKERRGRISFDERVQLARARGEQRIVMPANMTLYPVARSADELAELLPRYTVVIARPLEERSYITGENVIGSWHKFKIVETLAQAPPLPAYASRTIPQELLPIAEDEFVVHREGGTVTVNGVEVTQNDSSIPPFQASPRYMLLLSLDPTTRIGELPLGPHGILPINPDNSLDARREGHPLQQVVRNRHSGSIERLRADPGGRSNPSR